MMTAECSHCTHKAWAVAVGLWGRRLNTAAYKRKSSPIKHSVSLLNIRRGCSWGQTDDDDDVLHRSDPVQVLPHNMQSIPFIPPSIGDLLQSGIRWLRSPETGSCATSLHLDILYFKKQDLPVTRRPVGAILLVCFGDLCSCWHGSYVLLLLAQCQ